jgi:LuxR family transcriptional regulator, maltose regulon positive regulatory protein
LGTFEAWVEGERIAFVRKAQRRPLDLLKALVALGGHEVELDRIANALWPDADGDAARKSLESALYRVRKLMQQDGLIRLREGKLSLDARRVWVDATQLESELQRDDAAAVSQRVLALYRGHFLDNEREEPWLLPMRLKLRNSFFAWLRERGSQLERAGDGASAEGLYRRGLELDPTEEELCRRLMRLHRDCGDHVEAMRLYAHCKKALATLLAASPCGETEELRRSLMTMGASER